MTVRFAVLGSGAWGTAVAMLLARRPEHRVCMWSYRPEHTLELRERRENVRVLPGVRIPDDITFESDIHAATDGADLWVAAVPTVHLRSTLERERPRGTATTRVLSLCKGVENGTFMRPSAILSEVLGTTQVAALCGPSHAEEVARGLPASVVAASENLELATFVQSCFPADRFRVYTNLDIVGVELAAALKNVIAIAAGICDGLGCGDNAKAALLTRGLVEMARFGCANGGQDATFHGLAGMGDLITTCMSKHGRNRRVGERLAAGETLAAILSSTEMVAEGVYTARSVHQQAGQLGLELPIINEVYRVLYEDKSPKAAVDALMQRTRIAERQ